MKKILFVVLLIFFNIVNVYATSLKDYGIKMSGIDDRLYFLSLRRGNSILFQSVVNGEKVYGLYDAGKSGGCDNLITELKAILKDKPLEFLIISHVDVDHAACTSTVMKNVKVKSFYIKKYPSNSTASSYTKYSNLIKYANKYGVTTYQITSDKQNATDNPFYFVDLNGNKIDNPAASFTNKSADWNKSYLNLKLGNYRLRILNLPQRQTAKTYVSDNFNSLVIFGDINGSKLYLAGDVRNKSYAGTSSYSYKNSLYTTGAYNLADFYAAYLQASGFTGGNPLDLYQAGHHGSLNSTDTYVARKLIGANTKIVFTRAFKGYIDTYRYGTKKDNLLTCGSYSDSAEHARCSNDKIVNRIIKSLYKNPNKDSYVRAYYQNNFTNKTSIDTVSETLKFGFVFIDGNNYIARHGGTKMKFYYNKNIKV